MIPPSFLCILIILAVHCVCSSFAITPNIGKVDYDFVKNIERNPDQLLIDVREESEIKSSGQIPGSINIPMNSLVTSLGPSTSNTDFRSQFGHEKPSTSTQLIFTCRSGKRAAVAAEQAIALGYTNVSVYEGSWLDWMERTKKSDERWSLLNKQNIKLSKYMDY